VKTAALLPIHDDPLSLRFWLANYEAVWAGEVDELVVLISGPGADDVPCEGTNVRVIRRPGYIIHTGDALEELVKSTDADVLMFCEDDAYIRTPGVVSTMLGQILNDECDVIGSPREPASAELIGVSRQKFGDAQVGPDHGNALWPCFLFIRRSTLEQTNGKIGPTLYQRGDYVPGLDYTVTEATASDETFVGTCWQLRANKARFRYHAQHRLGDGTEMETAPWFHVGSLSSGAGLSRGALDGDEATNLAHIANWPDEFIRRISWWRRFADTAPPSKVKTTYSGALDYLMAASGIKPSTIENATHMADKLVTW
jgi:hypothetical protein